MDFREVGPSALHPTTQKELCYKGQVLIYLGWLTYKVMALAQLGGGAGGGGEGGKAYSFVVYD